MYVSVCHAFPSGANPMVRTKLNFGINSFILKIVGIWAVSGLVAILKDSCHNKSQRWLYNDFDETASSNYIISVSSGSIAPYYGIFCLLLYQWQGRTVCAVDCTFSRESILLVYYYALLLYILFVTGLFMEPLHKFFVRVFKSRRKVTESQMSW